MKDSCKKSLSETEVQDNVAGYYVEKRYKDYGLKYHSSVIAEMMKGINGNILDLGCGIGIIHNLYPNLDITGIDISEGMLRYHRGKHLVASADSIPFPDNHFDSVVCRSVLHHLPDAEKALKEIKRVLRPGGRFVCWETNKSWIATFVRKLTQHGDHFSDYHTSFSNLPSLINKYFNYPFVKYHGHIAYPLFGFPDIVKFPSILNHCFNLCLGIDEILSTVPIINKLGFAVMIKAIK